MCERYNLNTNVYINVYKKYDDKSQKYLYKDINEFFIELLVIS